MSERQSGSAVVASDEGGTKETAPPPNVVSSGGGGIDATMTTITSTPAPPPPLAPAGGASESTPPNDATHEMVESSLRPEERIPTEMTFVDQLQFRVDTMRQMHRLAAKFFYTQNFWMLFLPSMLISMVSGILSFVGMTDEVGPKQQQNFSLSVGVLSVVSVFFQALSRQLDYSHRSQEHEYTADKLDDMHEVIKFQMILYGQTGKNDLLGIAEDMQKEYKMILENCSSLLPIQIQNAFELISSRVHSRIFPPTRIEGDEDCSADKFKVDNLLELMVLVNNELFNAFVNSRGWPAMLPSAEYVVSTALARLDPHLGGEMTAQHKVLPYSMMRSSCCCWSLC